jgi:hypothetical protein
VQRSTASCQESSLDQCIHSVAPAPREASVKEAKDLRDNMIFTIIHVKISQIRLTYVCVIPRHRGMTDCNKLIKKLIN